MSVIKEPVRTGEHLVSEANGHRSREAATLAAGSNLVPGTVLGQVTATKKFRQLDPAATDGTEAAAAILYGDAMAAAGDVRAVIHARDAEVNGHCLVWPTGIANNDKAAAVAALAARGIIVRD